MKMILCASYFKGETFLSTFVFTFLSLKFIETTRTEAIKKRQITKTSYFYVWKLNG